MIVFGHRKCSGGTYRVTGRGSGHPPAKIWALLGQGRDRPAPSGLVHPHMSRPMWRKEKGRRKGNRGNMIPPSFPLCPLSFPPPEVRKGGGRIGGGPQVGFLLLGAPQGFSPPPPTYIYMGRGRLEHTTNIVSRVRRLEHTTNIVSRVWRPLHSLRLRSYSRSA